MQTSEILSALDTIAALSSIIPAPVGPIVLAAIGIAKEVVMLSSADPVGQLDELKTILRSGVIADWKSQLK